jgi:hypothetical protein
MNEVRAGLPIMTFADVAAFDAWLEAQKASAQGLWLKLAKKGAPWWHLHGLPERRAQPRCSTLCTTTGR